MNLFDFTNVQQSITNKKRDKFVFHYCLLKQLNIFPEELILVILHFRYHYMKHQLKNISNDIVFLTEISIMGAKFFKLCKSNESYNIFPNNIELDIYYDNLLKSITGNPTTLIPEITDALNLNPNLTLTECDQINLQLYPIIIEMKDYCIKNYGDITGTIMHVIKKDNENIHTKQKHFDNIIINIIINI